MKKTFIKPFWIFFLLILSIIFILPIIITIIKSTGEIELYLDFFLWKPLYINHLLNSILISITAAFFSILIAVPAAYVFAKVKFKFKNSLFFLYIIIMMMPFQVTLLPQYIFSKTYKIYDTYFALILPGVFAPLGIFLLTQIIKSLPNDILEAARLETASTFKIIINIVIPNVKIGIITIFVMAFTENWNMIEQPLVLLDSTEKYPLLTMFRYISDVDSSMIYVASTVFIILPLIIYAFFKDEIAIGLSVSEIKI